MKEQEVVELVRKVLDIVKYNLPVDCEEYVEKLRKKLLTDIRDLGVEKAFEKWLKEDEIEVEII